jgi:hypothetical protein
MSARPLTRLTIVPAALAAAFAVAPAAAERPYTETPSAATRVHVTLHDSAVALQRRRVAPGRVTFVVRNAGTGTAAFLLARTGDVDSLPRVEGVPFVPAGLVVARRNGIRAGASSRMTRGLARGDYLLVESTTGTFVRAATSLRVG